MPTTAHVPLILIRGFGGLNVDDERQAAYQGFNDGTVYPQKRGENYIYEGLILKYLKSDWRYHDATNVVGYYSKPVEDRQDLPPVLDSLPAAYFSGHRLVIDPGTALHLITALLVDRGDTVAVQAPTYPGALEIFVARGADVRAIGALDGARPSLIYAMANFNNPSGVTMTRAERAALVAEDFLAIARAAAKKG